ncbi:MULTISPECIES: TIGR00266 family protein [unclassified Sedimentibacter]|uniref:TIGR00266 family protein n=1 Tax=unclassified Sedimentibacter TaxID=2649220 RepID=UPI0027E0A614|nr:TIGR00266 family protein [Sedimentibacter sp. MB35-C1]WMJ76431.1 TIGR00266 family protein [Sedimentibacter sp. MB35-C1]
MERAHQIDYRVYGDDIQFVEISLDYGETIIAEPGAMMYMDADIEMDTVFGDGNRRESSKGFKGILATAGKRVLSGENLFTSTFTNKSIEKKSLAFAAPYPGKIIPVNLMDYGGQLICQRDSYLCSAKGIEISIAFQKKIGVGFFGGEGFIMQKLRGDGLAFLHAGGTIIKRELNAGEMLKLDTGCLVAFTAGVEYDVQFVGNVKSALFGGEGLFLATLRGPGTVWLQSLPFSRMADRIFSASKKANSGASSKGEGSLLGSIGIGNLFGED